MDQLQHSLLRLPLLLAGLFCLEFFGATTMPNYPAPQSTTQLFQLNGLPQWWNHPTQRFGQTDVTGGVEEGTDFAIPFGSKIGSITAGKVLYVGKGGYNDPSLGTVVQVQSVDGSIMHYQHLNSSNLKVGQQIGVGTVIGFSGGSRGRFSTGPHIEVRYASIYGLNAGIWSQKWIDPYTRIINLTRSKPNATGSGPTGAGPTKTAKSTSSSTHTSSVGLSHASSATTVTATTGFATPTQGPSFTLPALNIGPTSDVTTVLWSIDELMQLIPPWQVVNVQQDPIVIAGVQIGAFNDPISWIEGFLFNIGVDLIAIILRLILLVWGIFLGYKILSEFVDLSALPKTAAIAGAAL